MSMKSVTWSATFVFIVSTNRHKKALFPGDRLQHLRARFDWQLQIGMTCEKGRRDFHFCLPLPVVAVSKVESQMSTAASATLKARVKRRIKWPLIALVALLPDSVQSVLFMPRVRRLGERVPVLRVVYSGCYRTHPIDRQLGTDTGGVFPPEPLDGFGADAGNLPYMGTQPSVVRRVLTQIGDVRGSTFIDVGCGKGRPMIVATEFPFDEVLGYDLAAPLVDIANRNAKIVARVHAERPPMRAFAADALDLKFAHRKLVVFLFNPFGASVMSRLLDSLERALADGSVEALTVLYINPVCAPVFDASRRLARDWSGCVPYEPDEIGFGTGESQDVIIWKSVARPGGL